MGRREGVGRLAQRVREIAPFRVMEILARARRLEREGREIVHMEIGEPDFVTPGPIIDAGIESLRRGQTHYTPALGLPELRQAIAHFYRRRYGVEVAPGQVVITPGASGALQLVMGILLDPGDELLMTDPGYPCNRHFARLYEARAKAIPVEAAQGYQPDAAAVAAHWGPRTAGCLLASPANPTGTLIGAQAMREIVDLVADRDGFLIVDEIYHGLVYEGTADTVLQWTDQAFVINSFSKYFGMTGWRLGWVVAPPEYIEALDRLAQNLFLAPPTTAQYAALAAFAPTTLAVLEERRAEFRRRRDYLLPALRTLGFEIAAVPQGAFYLYADCSRFGTDSVRLCHDLLEEAGVAVTPGCDFGTHQAERHLRFAYTTSMAQLRLGVERLGGFLR